MGLALSSSISIAAPPFGGTVWVDPNIITDADYSSLNKISYSGQGMRTMFDRRVNGWVQLNAYLFAVDFDNGKQIEFQVNPEFGSG